MAETAAAAAAADSAASDAAAAALAQAAQLMYKHRDKWHYLTFLYTYANVFVPLGLFLLSCLFRAAFWALVRCVSATAGGASRHVSGVGLVMCVIVLLVGSVLYLSLVQAF